MKRRKPLLIYDGDCAFCRRVSGLAVRTLGDRLDRLPAGDPAVPALHPKLTPQATQARMYLLLPDGRLFGAAEAVARTLALAPWGRFALVYYLPGIGQLLEALYRGVAANRYRLPFIGGGCAGGTCALHFSSPHPEDRP